MRYILILLSLLTLVALSGCQAPLSIVPSTITPTPAGQSGPPAVVSATPGPTGAVPPPTPTASATPPPSPTPTATATATDTPTATASPSETATMPPTATAHPTRTPTTQAQSRRQSPTPTRRAFIATPTRARPLPTPSATRKASLTPRPPTRTPTRTPTPSATLKPSPARIRIEMTEAQLNQSVRAAIAKDPNTPVRSISIDTKVGKVLITALARIGFFNVNLDITVVVDVRNGRATPVIQEILVNGRPASGFLRQQVEAALQPYLNQIADISKDMYVEAVKISESGLSIDGRPK